MASDAEGNRVWITDFNAVNIYEIDISDIQDPTVETVVSNTECTPNGITYDGDNNRLVFTCWNGGNINTVDLTDYSVSTAVDTNLGSIDGIDHDENGNFYISSWNPTRITKLSEDFTVTETITASGLSNPADISYAVEIDSLAIANSGNGTVTYIYFDNSNNVTELEADNPLEIYPNPVTDKSYLEFYLTDATECSIGIYSLDGKLVHEVVSEKMANGIHRILLAGFSLESGSYVCELRTEEHAWTRKIMIE